MTAVQRSNEAFQRALLSWYDDNRRDLPWRRERDPYRIWVSEVMLQQTRVEAVISFYERFVERFPDAAALAAASEEDVLSHWAGLGYYRRARLLQAGVREVVRSYGGTVPSDADAVARLPGVGPYTAGAILSIAFGRPVPAVDGNVMRVLSRLHRLHDDVRQPASRRRFEAVAAAIVPTDRAGDFNQALMELGALVCVPGRPRCGQCPVQPFCAAFASGEQHSLPVRSRPPRPQEIEVACAVVEHDGLLLVERRPPDGLLASLWQFPTVELRLGEKAAAAVERHVAITHGLAVVAGSESVRHTHVFTHRRWLLEGIGCSLQLEGADTVGSSATADIPTAPDGSPEFRWVTPAEVDNPTSLPLAGPHRHIWRRWQARDGGAAKS